MTAPNPEEKSVDLHCSFMGKINHFRICLPELFSAGYPVSFYPAVKREEFSVIKTVFQSLTRAKGDLSAVFVILFAFQCSFT